MSKNQVQTSNVVLNNLRISIFLLLENLRPSCMSVRDQIFVRLGIDFEHELFERDGMKGTIDRLVWSSRSFALDSSCVCSLFPSPTHKFQKSSLKFPSVIGDFAYSFDWITVCFFAVFMVTIKSCASRIHGVTFVLPAFSLRPCKRFPTIYVLLLEDFFYNLTGLFFGYLAIDWMLPPDCCYRVPFRACARKFASLIACWKVVTFCGRRHRMDPTDLFNGGAVQRYIDS